MLDRDTVYLVGTYAIVFGAVVVLVSLPVVIVGVAHITATSRTVPAGLDALARSVPSRATLRNPRPRLSLGILGLGFGCWLLGAGLYVQGRIERQEKEKW